MRRSGTRAKFFASAWLQVVSKLVATKNHKNLRFRRTIDPRLRLALVHVHAVQRSSDRRSSRANRSTVAGDLACLSRVGSPRAQLCSCKNLRPAVFRVICLKFCDISKGFSQSGMCEFESYEVSRHSPSGQAPSRTRERAGIPLFGAFAFRL